MRKLLASISVKTLQERPDLEVFVKDVQAKTAALEQVKAQKELAKAALKLAGKELKKQLKVKPEKKAAAVKAATEKVATEKVAQSPATPKAAAPRSKKTLPSQKAPKVVA